MEDEYQNKYDNQSMVPDSLKFIAFLLLIISLVFAFLFLPEYERGQERKLIHYVFSLSYVFTGLFVSSVMFALAFICECMDKRARENKLDVNEATVRTAQ
ncbi:MAG: hypothetical protein CMO73_12610 [Verrucomicrobiales bacterium]|nr:hypothetical protein [Verrucomicrobiales bacterium]|tara:strand:+ start:162 stop:461 length:300 start_codon:yes stop_codon:yes gene_type:complete